MIQVGAEIDKAFAPQFSGYNTSPIGSQWDYDAAIAQARMDFKRFICPALDSVITAEIVEESYIKACEKLRSYIAAKNERYKKDYMLVRDKDHGQEKLRFDRDMYLMALKAEAVET
jgi:hypothetical protein